MFTSVGTQELVAREVLILSWLFGIALIGLSCVPGASSSRASLFCLFTILYWARWLCWALCKADRAILVQSGLFTSFTLGMALLGWAAVSMVQFIAGWTSVREIGPVALWTPALAFVLVATGWLLMQWSIRGLKATMSSASATARPRHG